MWRSTAADKIPDNFLVVMNFYHSQVVLEAKNEQSLHSLAEELTVCDALAPIALIFRPMT
jgi:hypothetical protein